MPDDRLLVETDAPYLTPQPVRKERNQPAFIACTSTSSPSAAASPTRKDFERLVDANAATLFGW